jgi:hypothetical protein
MKSFSPRIHEGLTVVDEGDEWRCHMKICREMRVAFSLFALTLGVAALVVPGSAGAARAEVEHWRHGDIARFHHEDFGRWRGGRWFHGDHFGRVGWWWIVDGSWFFYPAPVYPYPDPYIPPSVVAEVPPPQPAPQYWYYCPSANGYYPYVMSCPEGWTPVAPRPAP